MDIGIGLRSNLVGILLLLSIRQEDSSKLYRCDDDNSDTDDNNSDVQDVLAEQDNGQKMIRNSKDGWQQDWDDSQHIDLQDQRLPVTYPFSPASPANVAYI